VNTLSEAPVLDLEKATEIAAGLKDKATFDARSAINGTTYPTGTVKVYLNAALAHEMNVLADDLLKVQHRVDNLKASNGGIVESPEQVEAEAEAADLETRIEALSSQVIGSALTFHVRGLAPAQWRLIYKKWRKGVKQPVRKNFAPGSDGEEEFETEAFERNIERNDRINEDQVACAIVKVVNADGAEDSTVWSIEDVANLHATLLESEWSKLKGQVENLTFASNLFHAAVEQDADFLPKP
jgi:hypothetical protein